MLMSNRPMRVLVCVGLVAATAVAWPVSFRASQQLRPERSHSDVLVPPATPPLPAPTGVARLSGRVVDDTGAIVRNATVSIWTYDLRLQRTVASDANGQYEISDLPADRYGTLVDKTGYLSGSYRKRGPFGKGEALILERTVTGSVDIVLWRSGVISGRLLDEYSDPVGHVQVSAVHAVASRSGVGVSAVKAATTDDEGQFRISDLPPGLYFVVAVPAATRSTGREPSRTGPTDVGYSSRFYPDSPDVRGAQPVTLAPGGRVSVDFALRKERLVHLAGTAVDSRGQPLAGRTITIGPRDPIHGVPMPIFTAIASAEGTFRTPEIPAGDYRISAVVPPVVVGGEAEYAAEDVDLNSGTSVDFVHVTTRSNVTVFGRIVTPADFPPEAKSLKVTFNTDPPSAPGGGNAVLVDSQLKFQVRVRPSIVRFNLSGLPQGWGIESVRAGSRDVTSGVNVMQGAADIVIRLTNRPTRARGVVVDKGNPVEGCPVIAFPADSRLWADPLRHISYQRTDAGGRFQMDGLPPGNYLAVAFDDVDPAELAADSRYLSVAVPKAVSFSLREGEETAVRDLEVASVLR